VGREQLPSPSTSTVVEIVGLRCGLLGKVEDAAEEVV
jgi:hypothetical protein